MALRALDPVGPWRAQELVAREDLSEALRYEIVDGHLVVTPRPALPHQLACSVLISQLHLQCPTGDRWIVLGELDLPLGTDLRVPDVVVVRRETLRNGSQPLSYSAADFGLVVEVMSPSSRKTDLFAKPGEYAEAGIPLFLRLDLDPATALHAFVLRDGAYDEVAVVTERGTVPVPWGSADIDLTGLAKDLAGSD